jgi:WD40 repeat protein
MATPSKRQEPDSTKSFPDRHDTASSVDDHTADAGLTSGPPEPLDYLGKPEASDEIGRLAHYRVLRELGRGGMGCVLLAEDTKLQRAVALKVMLPHFTRDAHAKERFLREARAAAKVRHENIVTIFQVDEWNGVAFIALELLEGMPLDKYLKDEGVLPLHTAIRIACEVAKGLSAAHQRGLIHRDIKPGNLWLEALTGRVKILDFGLARLEKDDTHLTQSGAIVGTPAFMAPEQARGEKIDGRADLFSLGVILYRMTTGRQPFAGPTTMAVLTAIVVDTPPPPRSLNAHMPEAMEKLIMTLLEKDPTKRFATATDTITALSEVARQLSTDSAFPFSGSCPPTSATRPGGDAVSCVRCEPGTSPGGRKPRAKVLVALGLAVVTVGILAAQVIIRIQNKDGTETKIELPDAKGVIVEKEGKKVGEIPLAPKNEGTKGSAFDRLRREDIPAEKLKAAGLGDPAKAPKEVVAILCTSAEKPNAAIRFDVHPSGRLIALSYLDEGRIGFWDVESGKERPFAGNVKKPTNVKFSRDGKLLAIAEDRGTTRLWDVAGTKPVLDLSDKPYYFVHFHFLEEDRGLLFGRSGGSDRLTLFNIPGRKPLAPDHVEFESDATVRAIAVSPDGSKLVACVSKQEEGKRVWPVKVWDLPSGKLSRELMKREFHSLAFNKDGTRLLAASANVKPLFCFEFPSGKEIGRLDQHENNFNWIAVSPDGKLAASLDMDSTVRLWDPESLQEKQVLRLSPPHAGAGTGGVHVCQFTPDGRHLVVQNRDGTIYIVRLPGG